MTAAPITGVILAGGLGMRLRSVVSDRSKVLAEVNGRPFVTILLDQLAAAGIEKIVLCTGYFGDQVRQTLGTDYRGLPLHYSHEEKPLGTGGAIRQAFEQYEADAFLVLNGDSYIDADISAFRRWHEGTGRQGSLLLTWVESCARFGTVETEPDGRICGFVEKRESNGPGWVNAGLYLLSRELLTALPVQTPLSIERDFFPQVLERGLGGYRVHAPFIDIGTPESVASAGAFFSRLGRERHRPFVAADRDGGKMLLCGNGGSGRCFLPTSG